MLVSGSVDLVKITQIVVLEVTQAMGFAGAEHGAGIDVKWLPFCWMVLCAGLLKRAKRPPTSSFWIKISQTASSGDFQKFLNIKFINHIL